MKIILLTSNLGEIGGIQEFNRNLLRALKDASQEVSVVEIKNTNLFQKVIFVINFFKKVFYGADFVFCGHIHFGILAFLSQKIFKIPFILFTHGIEVWGIKSFLRSKIFNNAEKIVTVSNFTKEIVKKEQNIKEAKFFLLPNTIDEKSFFPGGKPEYLIEKYSLKDKKILFSLCRLSSREKYKGYDKIIEAMKIILQNTKNVVYMLGGSGDDEIRIREIIREEGLEESIIFTGRIPEKEKRNFYNLCDIFVMPSKGEGFGIVFLEALACGKPVVAGNQDASREAILNGKLGFLVDPESGKEISETITKILKREVDKNLIDGDFLRASVIDVFGFVTFRKKVGELIKKIQE